MIESEFIRVYPNCCCICVTKCDEHCPATSSGTIISSGLPSTMATLRAIWTVNDETVLIDYLDEHQAEAGDGLSFKMSTWNEAAVKVAESTMKGGPKDGTGCKNKWACVCICCCILITNLC